jgi:hypothetical protein
VKNTRYTRILFTVCGYCYLFMVIASSPGSAPGSALEPATPRGKPVLAPPLSRSTGSSRLGLVGRWRRPTTRYCPPPPNPVPGERWGHSPARRPATTYEQPRVCPGACGDGNLRRGMVILHRPRSNPPQQESLVLRPCSRSLGHVNKQVLHSPSSDSRGRPSIGAMNVSAHTRGVPSAGDAETVAAYGAYPRDFTPTPSVRGSGCDGPSDIGDVYGCLDSCPCWADGCIGYLRPCNPGSRG